MALFENSLLCPYCIFCGYSLQHVWLICSGVCAHYCVLVVLFVKEGIRLGRQRGIAVSITTEWLACGKTMLEWFIVAIHILVQLSQYCFSSNRRGQSPLQVTAPRSHEMMFTFTLTFLIYTHVNKKKAWLTGEEFQPCLQPWHHVTAFVC